MSKAPCYRCTTRTTVCHASCMAYREWAAEIRKANENHRKETEGAAYAKDNCEKWRRRRHIK